MILYDPRDHYWIIGGDEAQVYSSARRTLVPDVDDTYVAWCADHQPTRILSMDELIEVLRQANVPPYVTVTPRQARLALLEAGLLDAVETAVNTAGGATKIAWDYATEIYRGDPLIDAIGTALNVSEEQKDALFERAASF